jgi:ribosome maturation factor RimP
MHGGSRHGSHTQAQSRSAQSRTAQSRTAQSRAAQSGTARSGAAQSGTAREGLARPQGRAAGQAGKLPDTDRLVRLLEPVVHAMAMDLENVRVTAVGRRRLLRVVVDADGGVSLDDIALASRELSARLDNVTEMGELPYTLEVSSPGVDRPLTQPRHWRRATGRLVIVPLAASTAGNGAVIAEGRITRTSDEGVTLDCGGVLREFTYGELGPGRVQVEFGHLDSGADELDGEPDEED